MSEPSSGVPSEIADAAVEAPPSEEPTTVELQLDEDKLEAWDEVKGDYQVDPDGDDGDNDHGDDRDNGDGDGDGDGGDAG